MRKPATVSRNHVVHLARSGSNEGSHNFSKVKLTYINLPLTNDHFRFGIIDKAPGHQGDGCQTPGTTFFALLRGQQSAEGRPCHFLLRLANRLQLTR
ncbi:hypothetical protein S2091_1899 [Solimicrobium silvestre]|uniref:Uncharacterized protein n=1 Tax=Solimicrobium silvestre TaxID=2099400 RepID=A0A2S9H0K4_9BURK|nr:hypothetical protein S2091_1899 [Solimicrobium silvestre]